MSQSETPEQPRYLGLTPTQLNLAFFAVVGSIAIAVFAYLGGLGMVGDALGGGNDPSAYTAEDEATPTPGADDRPGDPESIALAAVLTLDDMPAGWTKDVDEGANDDLEVSPECAALNELDTPPGQVGYAGGDDFKGTRRQSVSNDATVFEDGKAAAAAMTLYKDTLTRCGDEFLAAFEKLVKDGLAKEGITGVPLESRWDTPTEIAFETESDSYRFVLATTVEGVDLVFTFDMYAMRAGSVVASYMYMGLGEVDTFEEQSIGLTAEKKLVSAAGSPNP